MQIIHTYSVISGCSWTITCGTLCQIDFACVSSWYDVKGMTWCGLSYCRADCYGLGSVVKLVVMCRVQQVVVGQVIVVKLVLMCMVQLVVMSMVKLVELNSQYYFAYIVEFVLHSLIIIIFLCVPFHNLHLDTLYQEYLQGFILVYLWINLLLLHVNGKNLRSHSNC